MNKQQLRVLARALADNKEFYPLNQTWQAIHQDYNIGLTLGNKLQLSAVDKAELSFLVKQQTGIDLQAQAISDFANLHREQALALAIDEKLAGLAAKRNRLALKATTGKALTINQQQYQLPDSGFLDLALETVFSVEHDCVIVVENFRCFDGFAKINLQLTAAFENPLVLYRGDNQFSEKTMRQLLAQLKLPVLAMPDIDLQGLVIAQSLPYVAGLLAPTFNELAQLLADPLIGNRNLYAQQLAGCQQKLANSASPAIQQLWRLLNAQQACIVQEYWLSGEIELKIH